MPDLLENILCCEFLEVGDVHHLDMAVLECLGRRRGAVSYAEAFITLPFSSHT